jgi:hypothetical protein
MQNSDASLAAKLPIAAAFIPRIFTLFLPTESFDGLKPAVLLEYRQH